ncbi:hypothetical protein BDQ17DRAFT_1429857 [Cyathus striatus]|nr:hypothetical protein BDQ17DRAFT_1429857 [Cyathus striatus]
MQSSSPLKDCPSTPTCIRTPLIPTYRPINSSPLAQPATPSKRSPLTNSQSRRRSQYKARTPNTPLLSSSARSWGSNMVVHGSGGALFTSGGSRDCSLFGMDSGESGQKAFLREKFKKRCLARAAKAREKYIRDKRYSLPSSEGFDEPMEEDSDEDDEDIMEDELFRRIMVNVNHKESRSYRISYANEVGSSFDPDFEDASKWEKELARAEEEGVPPDIDEAELEAYAEEYATQAALADFEDIPEEDLNGWSDFESDGPGHATLRGSEMDTS